MKLLRIADWPATALILCSTILPGMAAADTATGRVQLDRLTWSPDGGHLAVEARSFGRESLAVDTLLVDLSRGYLSERRPHPLLAAFDSTGNRLGIVTRNALYAGCPFRPWEMIPMARLDTSLGPARKLAFSRDGESLLVLRGTAGFDEITSFDFTTGRETVKHRGSNQGSDRNPWDRMASGEMTRVDPVPFGTIYHPVHQGLFFLERSMIEIQGLEGHWLYDLHFRNSREGTEVLLTRNFVPYQTIVSPDSNWIAIAGIMGRADYGGGMSTGLLLVSTDGSKVYTVHPEGAPDASVDTRAMSWNGRNLWFIDAGGLFQVEPEVGRARALAIGPAPPAWSDSLAPEMSVSSLVFLTSHSDTSTAVPRRDELRRAGFPAWITRDETASDFRLAVGAVADRTDLEAWGAELTKLGIEDFEVRTLPAANAGVPFPYGTVRGPDHREAFLISVGPPGLRAQELWITEKNGARRVRLIRAMGAGLD